MRKTVPLWAFITLFLLAPGCRNNSQFAVQGYVEGDFVFISSPLAGTLKQLFVRRGDSVERDAPLFALDNEVETAAKDEAARLFAVAAANSEDLKKGKRPSEVAALQAQLKQAQSALALAESELARQQQMVASRAGSKQDLDRAHSSRESAKFKIAELEADLKTASLGAREDQIAAADAELQSRAAALKQAEWALNQKAQAAPSGGLVVDTLYETGEWVAAGKPIVELLPPENRKIIAFVPERQISQVKIGAPAKVTVDGRVEAVNATVNYISPQAEFTPPVIYSEESRSKLVFKIELELDAQTATRLHPGQPVDISFEGV